MNRSLLATLTAATLLAFAQPSLAADPAAIASARKALQAAVNMGNVDGMLAARGQFDALSVSEPKNALLHYWVAVADWRVAPLLTGEANKAKGKRWALEGIDRAGRAYELDPSFADALALRCGLQGLYLQFDSSQMMKLGMQMEGDMHHARDLAPKNPRVALLDGINTLHKPGFVGGGARNALKTFEQAAGLFAAETVTDASAPDWGRDDVHAWAGRAAVKAGDFKEARASYQKALAVNPANGWVRTKLLPEVEKKLAAK